MNTNRNTTTRNTESGQALIGLIILVAVIAVIAVFAFGWPIDWRANKPSQAQQLACISNPARPTATAWFHKPLACAPYRSSIGLGNGTAPSYPEKVIQACNMGLETVTFEGQDYNCNDVNGKTPGTETPTNDEPGTADTPDNDNTTVFLLGGRWFDFISKGYESVTAADQTWVTNGAPMQPYAEQLITNMTELPKGLNVPDTFEAINDSLQALIVMEDSDWYAYVMPREQTSEVWFGQISWIQYDPIEKSVRICQDDLGGPGQWAGLCAGNELVVKTRTPLAQFLALTDFSHYADPLTAAMERDYAFPVENKAVIVEIYVKNAK